MNIKDKIIDLQNELVELRRDFHRYPELGLQEFRTANIIEGYLLSLGLEVTRCTPTGIVALLHGKKPGKTLMLRSDIDALPVEEETGLAFSSLHKGIMHACGHDGHAAMLLVTAKILSEYKDKINGTIKFVFQPNEEDAGAELMITEGVLENPRPDAVFGLHLWSPLKTGEIGIVPGAIMASSYYFKITINGKGGHGGAPHTAINPIDAATHVITGIKTLQCLEVDSTTPTVISVCKIHGGTKEIIVPDSIELEGSIRCLHDNDEYVRNRFEELVCGISQIYRCSAKVEFKCGNTVLNNDVLLTEKATEIAQLVVGKDNVKTKNISVMLGDDFAEFSKNIPGVYYFVGTSNEIKGSNYPHHHPKFDLDEDSLLVGVEMQVRLSLLFLNS